MEFELIDLYVVLFWFKLSMNYILIFCFVIISLLIIHKDLKILFLIINYTRSDDRLGCCFKNYFILLLIILISLVECCMICLRWRLSMKWFFIWAIVLRFKKNTFSLKLFLFQFILAYKASIFILFLQLCILNEGLFTCELLFFHNDIFVFFWQFP